MKYTHVVFISKYLVKKNVALTRNLLLNHVKYSIKLPLYFIQVKLWVTNDCQIHIL